MRARALLMLGLLAPAGASAQVSYDRLRHAEAEPGNWLTYSGSYAGHRYSPLAELTPKSVAGLKAAWVYQVAEKTRLETSPIVIDGILYITEVPHAVTAIDGRTGRALWRWHRPPAKDMALCCAHVNRGLAVLGDALFHVTLDNHLVALDLRTGTERWDVVLADRALGYSSTGAPLALRDKVVVGIGGGEFGIRGFIDAYDPKTGARLWRFDTIPGPGEPGHETWAGESWRHGGGGTWLTGSYDPELDLLYWGTGNPSPDYNGDDRAGDNLYTDSLVAVDATTGKLRWHFQYTPHDLHDWDSNQVPMLVDAKVDGKPRRLVVQANRNAFYYVLDRETGAFLAGTPFAKQTWATGLDAKGRPILVPNMEPSAEGTLVYPGLGGGTNWYSPSYSPRTGLVYVPARDDYAQTFFKMKMEWAPRVLFESGVTRNQEGVDSSGAVKALEAATGKLRWEFKYPVRPTGGLLSTAGGLVFGGNHDGYFFALDAASGEPLWRFPTGGAIDANPVSFLVDGKQHVAIASAQCLFVFSR
jgi:alcohol dehydrogenase (cytochrome c)